jgi:membrane protein implicated in regulation of membrane protease activity
MESQYIWWVVALVLGIAEMLTGTLYMLVLALGCVAGGAAATPANTLAWSVDGITWNAALAGGFTTAAYGLGWNGRQWLALGADSGGQTIEVSADGKSWSASGVSNPFTAEGHAAAWNGSRWVAVGAGSGSNAFWQACSIACGKVVRLLLLLPSPVKRTRVLLSGNNLQISKRN